jgi:hypothetical protein
VLHAIGSVNLLFEKMQPPHCGAPQILAYVGVSASNVQLRSKQVRELMDVHCFSTE